MFSVLLDVFRADRTSPPPTLAQLVEAFGRSQWSYQAAYESVAPGWTVNVKGRDSLSALGQERGMLRTVGSHGLY